MTGFHMSLQASFDSQLPGIEVFCERVTGNLTDPPDATLVEVDLHEYLVETIRVEDMIATAGPWRTAPTA